jgi:glyoxylase-like metal-dependent hydrolase (beta-lactamase superfamily II)
MTDLPEPRTLGHGIHLIPLPLPFASPRWVNAYAIESGDGIVLLDCGCDWEDGATALRLGLEATGLGSAPISTLIVTHLHPDHVGMAPRVLREHPARLLMHRRAARLVERYNDTPGSVKRNMILSQRHGVPDMEALALADVGPRPDFMPPIDPPDVVVDDGDVVELGEGRRLEVLHTPGHDPSHICLRDEQSGVVFSGDHVLPRITPVIMFDEDFDDVLADFLASLEKLAALPIGLTYPAHGGIIERGAQRVDQIVLHHQRRLSLMEERATAAPLTAWRLMASVFRPGLTRLEQRLALRETVSHLEHLRLGGRLRGEDRDGVLWYRGRGG